MDIINLHQYAESILVKFILSRSRKIIDLNDKKGFFLSFFKTNALLWYIVLNTNKKYEIFPEDYTIYFKVNELQKNLSMSLRRCLRFLLK